MPDLRELIREILIEVLDAMPERQGAGVKRERVTLERGTDLNDFAKSLVERAQDPDFADAVRDGRHVFDFDASSRPAAAVAHIVTQAPPRAERSASPAPAAPIVSSMPAEVAALTKSLITERDIAQLPQQQVRVRIASKSRLTPLAADELKRRGIKIERIPT